MSPRKAAFLLHRDKRNNSKAAPREVWDNHLKVLPLIDLNSA